MEAEPPLKQPEWVDQARDETGWGTRPHLHQGREDLPFVVAVVGVLMHDRPVASIDLYVDV